MAVKSVRGGCKTQTPPGLRPVGEGVSRIYSTTLLILLQHSVLQYFLLYIEQRLYGQLWVPLVLYSYLAMISQATKPVLKIYILLLL